MTCQTVISKSTCALTLNTMLMIHTHSMDTELFIATLKPIMYTSVTKEEEEEEGKG